MRARLERVLVFGRGHGHGRQTPVVDPGTAIASAWSSGISMYGVAALLGIAGRLDWTDAPAWLERPWVIVVASLLFAAEFVIDKVAAVDSAWDAVHTFVR